MYSKYLIWLYFYKSKIIQKINLYLDKYFYFIKLKTKDENKNYNKDLKYEWRGLHLDVARHAAGVKYLYFLIDKMEENNFNKLHLHLTDDQGWRMEIKKYPRLHEVGGKRKETVVGKNFPTILNPFKKYIGDKTEYSFFYSQKDLRDLVLYAKSKNITIVPEVDIPGHCTAMLYSYPEFSFRKAPEEVATYWGVFNNVLSDEPKSINFLKDIFDEIIEVFDSEYIHIGGDEVSVKNYDEKYNNILKEISKYLKSKNKKVIMWDDAFNVALDSGAILMVWKSVDIGKEFLKKGGSEVIFCPVSHMYFDYYQHSDTEKEPLAIGGYLPIDKVYSFRLEKELGLDFFNTYKNKILGIQANVWTEYMNNESKLDYMIFPRFYALSEVVNRNNYDYDSFVKDLKLKINKI